jgi:hypothetical protein
MAQEVAELFPLATRCHRITSEFCENPLAMLFLKPFRPPAALLANYQSVVNTPMDLTTVRNRIAHGTYTNYRQWAHDMALIWDNAVAYNGEHSVVGGVAIYLRKRFQQQLKGLELSNIRNFESELMQLTRRLADVVRDTPGGVGPDVDCDDEFETFSIDRFRALAAQLGRLSRAGCGPRIMRVLAEANPDVDYPPDGEIELAELPRKALLALEQLVAEVGDQAALHDSAVQKNSQSIERLKG